MSKDFLIVRCPRLEMLSWMAGFSTASHQLDAAEAYVMDMLAELVGRPLLPWRA